LLNENDIAIETAVLEGKAEAVQVERTPGVEA